MDRDDQQPGELDGDFFHRLEVDLNIQYYFVILPPRCKVLGTVFEGGMLERDFHWGGHPKITVFLHESIIEPSDHAGSFEFREKGKRTRYMESVVARAENVVVWAHPDALMAKASKQTRALAGP